MYHFHIYLLFICENIRGLKLAMFMLTILQALMNSKTSDKARSALESPVWQNLCHILNTSAYVCLSKTVKISVTKERNVICFNLKTQFVPCSERSLSLL